MNGCRFESNCPLVGPGTIDGAPSVELFLRDPSLYLCELRRKPLGRQARPGFEPGALYLPVLSAETPRYRWGLKPGHILTNENVGNN